MKTLQAVLRILAVFHVLFAGLFAATAWVNLFTYGHVFIALALIAGSLINGLVAVNNIKVANEG